VGSVRPRSRHGAHSTSNLPRASTSNIYYYYYYYYYYQYFRGYLSPLGRALVCCVLAVAVLRNTRIALCAGVLFRCRGTGSASTTTMSMAAASTTSISTTSKVIIIIIITISINTTSTASSTGTTTASITLFVDRQMLGPIRSELVVSWGQASFKARRTFHIKSAKSIYFHYDYYYYHYFRCY
jgi:hypothetical protein